MKEIILILLSTLVFTSCKKEYECSCTHPRIDMSGVKIIKDTKKKSKSICSEQEKELQKTDADYRCYLYRDGILGYKRIK